MTLKTKVTLLVGITGVVYAGLSAIKGRGPDFGVLKWTTLIAGGVWLIVLMFNHYGWRMIPLRKLATSPNLRGTWRFDDSTIVRTDTGVKINLSGYIVVNQSDSHIRVRVLWPGGDWSGLHADAPTAVSADKICFVGTYANEDAGADRGVVAYFTATSRHPTSTWLRYCNDNDESGAFKAEGRVPRQFDSYEAAHAQYRKPVQWWERALFAVKWT